MSYYFQLAQQHQQSLQSNSSTPQQPQQQQQQPQQQQVIDLILANDITMIYSDTVPTASCAGRWRSADHHREPGTTPAGSVPASGDPAAASADEPEPGCPASARWYSDCPTDHLLFTYYSGGIQIVQQIIGPDGGIQQIPIQLNEQQLQLIRAQMIGQTNSY